MNRSIWYDDVGEIILRQTTGFTNPITFTPTATGRVNVKVQAFIFGQRGTFAVTYGTGTRPAITPQVHREPLAGLGLPVVPP